MSGSADFPEGEEVLICGFRLGGVALHNVGAAELKVNQ
jgi:hypothetical protein